MSRKAIFGIIFALVITGVILTPVVAAFNLFGDLLWDVNFNRQYYWCSHGYGESMYPTIHSGDLLLIQLNTHPDFEVEPGDIIVYLPPESDPLGWRLQQMDTVICHRVVADATFRDEIRFLVQGDNCTRRDPWEVKEEYIIGTVEKIVPSDEWFNVMIMKKITGYE